MALEDVQGNILRAFNKEHQWLLFFRFKDLDRVRNWLSTLASSELGEEGEIMVMPSTRKVIETLKLTDKKVKQTWLHIGLSYTGIKKLDLEPPPSAGIYKDVGDRPDNLKPDTDDPFKIGMQNRNRHLNDNYESHPSKWKELYRGLPENPDDLDDGRYLHSNMDAVFLVASDTREGAQKYCEKLKEASPLNGALFLDKEIGRMMYENGGMVEHFGFRDGLSQPLIEGIDDEEIIKRRVYVDALPYHHFVLTGLEALGDRYRWANNGSFFVFRKLQQDVPGFWDFMQNQYRGRAHDAEELAAKFFGRNKDGTPLVQNPDTVGESKNDFLYSDDHFGEDIPKFSHIRKCNPRDSNALGLQETNRHRILRRGIPYGKHWSRGIEEDGNEVRGLLFICYQRDITEQFEYIQQNWANMSSFPQSPSDFEKPGPDPIAGLHYGRNGPVTMKYQDKPSEKISSAQWVKTTGGGYFFSPSISALRELKKGN